MNEDSRVVAKSLRLYAIGANQHLVWDEMSGRAQTVPSELIQALASCTVGASWGQQAERLADASGGLLGETALGQLRSADLLLEYQWTHSDAERALPIECVGIPTADRPELLRRCLASLTEHVAAAGRSPRIVVVDGSADLSNAAENRQSVLAVRRQTGMSIEYVGAAEIRAIVHALGKAGLPMELVEFCIGGGGTGANRNVLLLLSKGQRLLMVDDDVLCRTWAPAGGGGGLAFVGAIDPRASQSFGDRAEALMTLNFSAQDLLGAHSRLLGRELCDLWKSADEEPLLASPCEHLLRALRGTVPGRVALSIAGIAGDAGVYCPLAPLFNSTAQREVGALDSEGYRLMKLSRERVRVAVCDTVTHNPFCMAYCLGVDNTTCLAPFAPSGRNQDGLFGELVVLTDDRRFVGHIACGVVHDSERPSEYPTGFMPSATETRVCDLLSVLCRMTRLTAVETPERRLAALGAALSDLAAAPTPLFASEIRSLVLEARARQFACADSAAMNAFGFAAEIARDISAYRAAWCRAAADGGLFLPREFISTGWECCRDYVGRFADLLLMWPRIWHSADSESVMAEALVQA